MILSGCWLMSGAMALPAAAQNAPGVSDREIKIGQTMPYTGPGARFSANGLAEIAYMKMINDQGGINGRKISLISVDDGFMPWRTGNETRKLVEVEQVAFVFGSIGTTTQLSVAKSSTSEKFRSCSSRAALTARRVPRTRPIRSAAYARATGWERASTSGKCAQAEPKCENLHPLRGQ